MLVSTVQEMRDLDARAVTEYRIPSSLLMENAGDAVYWALGRARGVDGRRYLIICGPGNNGGDGFVVARKLYSSGGEVRVVPFGGDTAYGGPGRTNLGILKRTGVRMLTSPTDDQLRDSLAWCDVVVDGLLGTGMKGAVRGRFRSVIQAINDSNRHVVSIDIPSGVDGDTGQVQGVAVRADETVTFGLPKRGNLLGDGAELGGHLLLSSISFPPELVAAAGIEVAVNYPAALPPSPGKGKLKAFADVVFVAGAQNPADSTAFASMALVEIGGGLPRFVVPRSLVAPLEGLAGRTILVPQDETKSGTLALSALDEILDLGHSANLAILEPGRSPANETQDLIRQFCRRLRRPLLVNGDVLAGGGEDLGVLRNRPDPTVLVLQPSELFRLVEVIGTGASTDPVPCAQALAKDLGAFVVLRGRPPLIGLPDGRVFIDLIDKFTGDYDRGCNVLPGAIGAMWELGFSPAEAIRTALFLHGLAGQMVARNTGQPQPNARLIVEAIPSAIRMLRDTYSSMMSGHQGAIEVI